MHIIKLLAIDSTNSYLKQLAKQMPLDDGTIVNATSQKKGRGQQENIWQSQEGKSLTFSMYKRFKGLEVKNQAFIGMATALAIHRFLLKMKVPQVSIKWPNDILSYHKKCCGILIENEVKGVSIHTAIIGVGLNVNETIFNNLPHATSLRLATNKSFDLAEILQTLQQFLYNELEGVTPLNFENIKERYESFLFGLYVSQSFTTPEGSSFEGMITGVTSSGELRVLKKDKTERCYANKQIFLSQFKS